MHTHMYTCSYILCGNIVLFCFCFTGATTSSIEQPTPTADSSSPGIYKYYDCVTTLIEQVTLPMRMPVLFFVVTTASETDMTASATPLSINSPLPEGMSIE